MLSNRKRLLRTFKGQEIDRFAVSPFIYVNFANEFHKMNISLANEAIDEKIADIYRFFGFDTMLRSCTILDIFNLAYLDSKNWHVTVNEAIIDHKKRILTTIIKTPEREMREIKEFVKISECDEISAEIEHLIKDEEDFKQFVKYQPEVPKYNCTRIKRAKDIIGDEGIVAPWVSGVFNTLSRLRKVDDLVLDAYTDHKFYSSMMEYFTLRLIEICSQVAEAGADVITFEGNIANGTLTGPNYFAKNILSYESRIISAIKEKGSYVLYHNCGDSNNMFEVYNKLGFDALESLTEKPYGDTELENALKILNKDIVLIGNIDQIDFLKNSSEDLITTRVKRLLNSVKTRGRFVLATSDYLSEGTPYENIHAFCKAGKEFTLDY